MILQKLKIQSSSIALSLLLVPLVAANPTDLYGKQRVAFDETGRPVGAAVNNVCNKHEVGVGLEEELKDVEDPRYKPIRAIHHTLRRQNDDVYNQIGCTGDNNQDNSQRFPFCYRMCRNSKGCQVSGHCSDPACQSNSPSLGILPCSSHQVCPSRGEAKAEFSSPAPPPGRPGGGGG